jgi:very-short-patch-repair endonuclease
MKKINIDFSYMINNSFEKSRAEWIRFYNLSNTVIDRVRKLNNLEFKPADPRVVSEETKIKISKGRKNWLKQNPEKHPWRKSNKFKSIPCENVKSFLRECGIEFLEEYQPIEDRYFSIDIAIPSKMIALEINGNQHYEKDGSLKEYYQIRHDLLVSSGWRILEIHYSLCFDFKNWASFIKELNHNENYISDFKLVNKQKRSCKDNCSCGNSKHRGSAFCLNYKNNNRFDWPDLDTISKLVWEMPSSLLSKKLGVSDSAIYKFCLKHNISKPPRGYWSKK